MKTALSTIKSPQKLSLYKTLRTELSNSEIGARIPSTHVICQRYNAPIRQVVAVLRQLENEGWIKFESPRIRVVSRPEFVSRFSEENVTGVNDIETNDNSPVLDLMNVFALITPWPMVDIPLHPTSIRAHFVWNLLRCISIAEYESMVIPSVLDSERIKNRLSAVSGVVAVPGWEAFNRSNTIPDWLLVKSTSKCPIVMEGDQASCRLLSRLNCDLVFTDHRDAARRLALGLAERGCQRLAVVIQAEHNNKRSDEWWIKERLAGYAEGAKEAGVELVPDIILPDMSEYINDEAELEFSACQTIGFLYNRIGSERIDGLLVFADVVAGYVARACRMLGIIPGQDILLTGYDDCYKRLPLAAWEPDGIVLSVTQEYKEVAKQMINILLRRRSGELSEEFCRYMVKPQLTVHSDHALFSSRPGRG